MAQAKQQIQPVQQQQVPPPVSEQPAPQQSSEAPEVAKAKSIEPAATERQPGMKRFRLEKPNGEVSEHEAATVEDAIRQMNSSEARGKVFTFKSLKVTEI